MHTSVYCGLTDYLTESNFFLPLCDKHGLMGSPREKQEELKAVQLIGVDNNGARACSMYEVCAVPVVGRDGPCQKVSRA
eukprot:75707-Prymnesium_polylepis.1